MKKILSFKLFEQLYTTSIKYKKYKLFIKSDCTEFSAYIDSLKSEKVKFKWDILNKKIWDKILQDNFFAIIETDNEEAGFRFIGVILDKNLEVVKTKSIFLSFYNCNHYCPIEKLFKEYWPNFTSLQILNEKGYNGDLKNLFEALNSLYNILQNKEIESKIMTKLQMTTKDFIMRIQEFFKSLDKREQKFSLLAQQCPKFYNYMLEVLDEQEAFKSKLNKDLGDLGF